MVITGILGVVLAMGSVQFENGPPKPREGRQAFERMDQNHDGVIDRGEFDRALRQRRDSGDRRGPNAGPPQGAPGAGPMYGQGEIRERIREKVREHVRHEMGARMNACPNCPMNQRDGHRVGPPEGDRRGAPQSEMRHRHGHNGMEHHAPPPLPDAGPGAREFKSHGPSHEGGPGKQDAPRMRGERGERRMGRFFERFDEDHDGKVDREEMRRTIRRHAQPPTAPDRENENDRDD
ncbi:MAG: EF-hand domain-containing protein [Planctomycetota bacterium]